MGIKHKTLESGANSEVAGEEKGMSSMQRILTLVIGDAVVFFIFALIGRRSHNEASGLDAIGQIVLTALPFALGWFIVAPFIGAFKRDLVGEPRKMAVRTALCWLASFPLGMLIRIGGDNWRIPNWTFFLVALLSNTVFLLLWRLPFAWFTRKRG